MISGWTASLTAAEPSISAGGGVIFLGAPAAAGAFLGRELEGVTSAVGLTGPRKAFPNVNLNGDLRAAALAPNTVVDLLPNTEVDFVDLVLAIFLSDRESPRTPVKRAKYNFSKRPLSQDPLYRKNLVSVAPTNPKTAPPRQVEIAVRIIGETIAGRAFFKGSCIRRRIHHRGGR